MSILKFQNFLTESSLIELVLEGNLMATPRFLDRLAAIDNPIAKVMHKAFADKKLIDKDLPQNWIDVTDKEDSITFTADRSATRLNNNPEDIYKSNRNEARIGRFTRSILNELGVKATDKEIEDFVNLYKSTKVDTSLKFQLVSGSLIKKYYLEKNYAKSSGTLGGSCMRHEECQKYFKIYTKNPESCQLLVYLDADDKVLGRALVWKIHKKKLYTYPNLQDFECSAEYFMDRVYVSKDSDVNKFINYAKQNGWLYKYRMTSDDQENLFLKFGDQTILGKIVVKLSRLHTREYPFVDTLTFADGDSKISNVGFTIDKGEDDDEGFIMSDTSGGTDTCSCDGTGYDDDDSDDCRECDGDGEVNCPKCRGTENIVCDSCGGDGDITCDQCNGDGDTPCTNCDGNGSIPCQNCDGGGTKLCSTCGGDGTLGNCTECSGAGSFDCAECKNEPLTCKNCKGEGTIVRKWGVGLRKVNCPDCRGAGKASSGETGREGCKCSTCSYVIGRNWWNKGSITCKKCNGGGELICKSCEGDGDITCQTCDGDGSKRCDDCRWGNVRCKKCNGDGQLGQCKKCKGEGSLGDCKDCDNGQVKCTKCNGSGKKDKSQKKPLCPECAGLLDEMMNSIRKGSYKLR